MLAITLIAMLVGITVFAEGGPTLATDKDDYLPSETVIITGTNFAPNTEYDLPVIRPNYTIVKGDGSFISGWELVTSDASGNFTYYYKLNGIYGLYEVRAYQHDQWQHDHATWTGDMFAPAVAVHTFTDAPPVQSSAPNHEICFTATTISTTYLLDLET